ncbi:hypothetical protein L1987_70778 [Smallanthus sonchifolius]|uniref:Uncharacterized protein n=1 Tax=Smallanthus sonchifolius TaxID=185202 RepID=A0ACB9AQU0_9ASTR|nr:hypothetical protein L1987_70778 [Smallanthus sonchifolius]
MDALMLIPAYGKQGDFNKSEIVFSYLNKKGYPPSVKSLTALIEAYGKRLSIQQGRSNIQKNAIFKTRVVAITHQIVLKIFVEIQRSKVKPDADI